ncbi:MAG: LPS export ABC transporter ATP-binding protein [Gammaproteobacteria bacterium]|nr:LPS export ABC transporter ATP-binding protein [Gammaproteobacteria bacterium]MCW8909510.1 LPS export ABC transporter ATP-binding protein [Gammaproteobacteria bacterium]MCW9004407.1 LPS export ABC transporter ATP-binding protein [Gammaproteobacteria bacterium]MCW9055804.1 LPS export ABC transporter ATP-binding protein [Gammaproteobacteria bacterium]
MNILRADNLIKTFRSRKVVDQVSISVRSGEVIGLLGPNGAGKTTSFYMMVGLIQADKGNIFLNEKNITQLPMHNRARMGIGYLPQEASVFRKLSVTDNIMAILETRHDLSRSQRKQRLQELLDDLQIDHIRDNTGISLSGGERRRVEIARALAAEPGFILLDEPFAGVDPISVLEIQRIIQQLTERNIGVLITDHNVRETLGICQRAYIMSAGQVIAEGSPEAVMNDENVKDVYLGHNFSL